MSKQFQRLETDRRLLAIAAARLRSEGLTQLQIASRLQRSRPEISGMLAYAEEHGFLELCNSF